MLVAYWAVVAVGAVTLIIEAYRQFSTPLDVEPHDRYPILRNVDLDALCTKGELLRGFLMYAALYLCAYAAILTSTELYSIVAASETASSSDSSTLTIVGAREGIGDDADLAGQTSGFDLSKPILVSAAIVSALSIGLFSPIERVMRSYAHWIAAIPRGVYRVIGSLKRANYTAISPRTKGPLETALNESLAEDQALEPNAGILREIRESLKTVDVLYASVLGSSRDQIFAVHKHRPIETLIETMEGEYEQVRSALVGDGLNEGNIEAVHMKAGRLRNNIQALFALLFIRNDKVADTTQAQPNTVRLIEHLQNDREPTQNALAGAVFIMAISVLVVYPVVYLASWWQVAGETDGLPQDLVDFIRNETLVSLIQSLLMFGLCAGTALLSREASMEYGRWQRWPLNHIPFLRFFTHALFPGLAAVLLCSLAKLGEYFLAVETNAFDVFVAGNWQFCLMNFFFGFSIAIAVFVTVDQHERLSAPKTIVLSAFATAPFVLWAIFVQSLEQNPTSMGYTLWLSREVFLLSLPALVFAIAFGALLELSEEQA